MPAMDRLLRLFRKDPYLEAKKPKGVCEAVGRKFIIQLVLQEFLLTGMIGKSVSKLSFHYLRNYINVDSAEKEVFNIITNLPWIFQGIVLSMSFLYPLFGYAKLSYIMIFQTVGFLSASILAAFPRIVNLNAIKVLFFTMNTGAIFSYLLIRTKYYEYLSEYSEQKNQLRNIYIMASITAKVLSLYVVEAIPMFGSHSVFLIFALSFYFSFLLSFFNFLGDKKVPIKFDNTFYKENRKWYIMVFIAIPICVVSSITQQLIKAEYIHVSLAVSLVVIFILIALPFIQPDKKKSKSIVFIMFNELFDIGMDSSAYDWLQSDATCVRSGPKLKYSYIFGFSRLATLILPLLINIKSCFCKNKKSNDSPRKAFFWSSVLKCTAFFVEALLVSRAVKSLDMVLPVVSYEISHTFPEIVTKIGLASFMEGEHVKMFTVLLTNYGSLGAILSRSLGFYLIKMMGFNAQNAPCSTSSYVALMFMGRFLSPCVLALFIFLLPITRKGIESIFY